MLTPAVVKQPAEQFPVSVQFAPRLPNGEAATSAVVTARNKTTGADTTATVLQGTATVDGTVASQIVKGGTDGDDHILTWRVTTSPSGFTLEEDLQLSIRAQ